MKPKASYYTTQLKNLTNEVYMLQSRLLELKEEHTTLQVQQHILASVCDALNWLRGGHAQAAVHQRWLAPGAKAGAPSEAELALLHQLGTITDSPLEQQLQQLQLQHSSSKGTKSSHQSLHTEQHTADTTDATQSQQQSPQASAQFNALSPHVHVAAGGSPQAPAYPAAAPPEPGAEAPAMQPTYLTDPPGHYLGMLWHTLSRAPDPRARSMTLQDFAQYWAGLVKELSLCLTLTEQQGPQYAMQQDICAGMQHPLQALQDHLLKHLGLVTALVLQNRVDLVHPLRLINLSTLELSDTPEQVCLSILVPTLRTPMNLTGVTASISWLAPLALQLQPALISSCIVAVSTMWLCMEGFARACCPLLQAYSM